MRRVRLLSLWKNWLFFGQPLGTLTGAVSGGHARDYCQYGAQPTITPTLLKPMNVFWLPPEIYCETTYQYGDKLGGARDELSLTIHSDFRVNVPPLPVLFAHQMGVWVMVQYSEAEPVMKQFCCHLRAQSVVKLHELAKLTAGNVRDGFHITTSSDGSSGPCFLSEHQQRLFENYCEVRTNLEGALSNYRKAEIGRNQANALYLQTQATWLQAEGMLESIEEDCREAGFDPTCYLENEVNA